MRIIYIAFSFYPFFIPPAKHFGQLDYLLNYNNYGTFRRLIFVRLVFAWINFDGFRGVSCQISKSCLILLSPKINPREILVEGEILVQVF